MNFFLHKALDWIKDKYFEDVEEKAKLHALQHSFETKQQIEKLLQKIDECINTNPYTNEFYDLKWKYTILVYEHCCSINREDLVTDVRLKYHFEKKAIEKRIKIENRVRLIGAILYTLFTLACVSFIVYLILKAFQDATSRH